ncbi:MAG TPA: hypothetical protein VMZ53_13740 [Kofleriaceae bacterium]|nr:hypothetical protein [Kofleriaceae bacterium]
MRAWALLLLGGCGRLAFDPLATDAPKGDAAILPPFVVGQQIASLASPFADDDPTITPDGLELIFASDRTGNTDLYVSRRASRGDPWSAPTLIAELATVGVEKGPEYSDDGLTLWFEDDGKIAMTTRATRGSAWATPQIALAFTVSLGTPTVCNGDLQMIMRTVDATSANELYTSSRASVGDAWPTPVPLDDIETGQDESGPFLTPDCSRLYFDSVGVFVSDRDPVSGHYGAPVRVIDQALQTCHDISLSDDEHYAVFSKKVSNIEQLWEATR